MLEEIRRASAAYADRGHAVTMFAGVLPPMLDILIIMMSSIGVTLLAGVLCAGSTLSAGAGAPPRCDGQAPLFQFQAGARARPGVGPRR